MRATWETGSMFDFSATHWSQVHLLGQSGPSKVEERRSWDAAWESLTRKYHPAFCHAAKDCLRRMGRGVVSTDQAEDVVQAFLAACLHKGWLARAAPEFGRFRAFVFTVLRRFTLKYIEAAGAKKRHPESRQISLSEILPDLGPSIADPAGDESLYTWVQCIVAASLDRVGRRSPTNAKVLELALQDEHVSNATIGELLGLGAEKVALARHRGLHMLREEIRAEVVGTVSSQADYTAELELLQPYLAHSV